MFLHSESDRSRFWAKHNTLIIYYCRFLCKLFEILPWAQHAYEAKLNYTHFLLKVNLFCIIIFTCVRFRLDIDAKCPSKRAHEHPCHNAQEWVLGGHCHEQGDSR